MTHKTNTSETLNQIQLGNLNDRLKKYIKGFDTDYESIYKAGVEIGRRLALNA